MREKKQVKRIQSIHKTLHNKIKQNAANIQN